MGIEGNDREELFVTIAEAAAILRCSAKRIHNMRADKTDRWGFRSIPSYRVGGMVLYERADIEAFARSRREQRTP